MVVYIVKIYIDKKKTVCGVHGVMVSIQNCGFCGSSSSLDDHPINNLLIIS
jgi:hypothetical protein